MSNKTFINYGTFLELASLLNPENYSASGQYTKSPKGLVNKIKMFDLYLYRFNHRIGLYPGAEKDMQDIPYFSPYDFCSDTRLSKDNLGFDLEEYTKSLITKIKDEKYIPSVADLNPYQIFIDHKMSDEEFPDGFKYMNSFDTLLGDFLVGNADHMSPYEKDSSVISSKFIDELQNKIQNYSDNFESPLPNDCYYSELSESNCVARMQQVKKNMNILCCKLDNLNSMKNINPGQRSKERNSTLRELGNYAKIYDDLMFFNKTHKCLPKSKSELEFCRTFPDD